jgi:hypothetical protein
MSVRASVTDRPVDLPPPYRLVTLRESGDAFAHACATAGETGAGLLVWVRRFDVAEFAVVLEPEEKLRTARRAHYVCMNALGDALAAHAPPEMPLSFDWPDAVRIDGVLVGGGRLGWPAGASEAEAPDWLVFAATIRTAVIRADDPGMRPLLGALDELGFEAADAGEILASFARYLMAGFHDWSERGAAFATHRFLDRLPPAERARFSLDEQGDLPERQDGGSKPIGSRSLAAALAAAPSWRDPKTGMPWL